VFYVININRWKCRCLHNTSIGYADEWAITAHTRLQYGRNDGQMLQSYPIVIYAYRPSIHEPLATF
jgi:hypothetical protein